MPNEAIAAIATAAGRGGIGVIRVSGKALTEVLRALVKKPVSPRRVTRADFYDADGSIIDQGIVLYYQAPASYTGEDVIEIQAHGGPVVLQLLLRRCLELGARVAEPGEFTKRAYLNDKLDLAQAESVADLIDAATAQAARCAGRSLRGEFSECIQVLVADLVETRARVEAALDFPEDELDPLERGVIAGGLQALRDALAQVMVAAHRGSLLRDGLQIVIAGHPNVGKSSLMNRLAREEIAIVTDIPGTTRDPVRHALALSGVPLFLVDTAGLRESAHPIEQIGMTKTHAELARADLILWISDASRPQTVAAADSLPMTTVPRLHVLNKIDLTDDSVVAAPGVDVRVSAKNGTGIADLERAILAAAGWSSAGEGAFAARERHLQALLVASDHLTAAAVSGLAAEVMAEELRLAQRALSSITGNFTADDLLGEIFAHFCIGK